MPVNGRGFGANRKWRKREDGKRASSFNGKAQLQRQQQPPLSLSLIVQLIWLIVDKLLVDRMNGWPFFQFVQNWNDCWYPSHFRQQCMGELCCWLQQSLGRDSRLERLDSDRRPRARRQITGSRKAMIGADCGDGGGRFCGFACLSYLIRLG